MLSITIDRYKFRPRFLRDVSKRDLSTTILGHKIAFPVCISPTAMNRMAHPDGELASAKGTKICGCQATLTWWWGRGSAILVDLL